MEYIIPSLITAGSIAGIVPFTAGLKIEIFENKARNHVCTLIAVLGAAVVITSWCYLPSLWRGEPSQLWIAMITAQILVGLVGAFVDSPRYITKAWVYLVWLSMCATVWHVL